MTTTYTVNTILESLGYADPMLAARQQARMQLLGRLARYQAHLQEFEQKWGVSLTEMRRRYERHNSEDFAVDDDYLQWQWYAEAAKTIESQLEIINAG